MKGFNEEQLQKLKNFFHMKETPEEREIFLIEKTKKYAKLLSWIPWILFVWVWNSVAMNTAHKDSDIDLFIITKKNRLWITRIITTLFFSLIGQRKTAHNHKELFCLSFFITEEALDFSTFAIKNDIYLYFRVLYMKPIVDINNTYHRFLQANKSWINIDEYSDIIEDNKKYITISKQNTSNNSKLWDFFERTMKNIFLPKTIRHFEKLWKPYWVVIWDDILKFHDKDIRLEIREKIFS
jgi:predicted nucleotidyltransferase